MSACSSSCASSPLSSGPIDALATDGDGRLYLIETKLYKNPDKRLVLAQILDYGAALWKGYVNGDEFVDRIDALMTEKGGRSLRQALSDTYGPDAELDILIPTLFGAEVRKTTARSSPRGHWDADRFLEDARQRLTAGEFAAVKALHAFAVAHTDRTTYGSGQQTGSINFKSDAVSVRSLFTLWTDGRLQLNFKWLNRSESELTWRARFGEALMAAGIALPANYLDMFPFLLPDTWVPRLDAFISVVKRVLQDSGGSAG